MTKRKKRTRTDRERLDWLEPGRVILFVPIYNPPTQRFVVTTSHGCFPTLRAAIDYAMDAGKKGRAK